MKIWAHRGCSQMYPENTLLAFEKALSIEGLTGIELDVQMTKDKEIVVIHDERVDRTTDGTGYVKDFTYSQLRRLAIETETVQHEKIPSIMEVLDLLQEHMRRECFLLNIELKNNVLPYEGMEEKIVELIHRRGLGNAVVYSSFYAKSLEKLKILDVASEIGILDNKVSDCIYKVKGGCGATALHPFWKGIDLAKEQLRGQTVRAWFVGHLYPEKPTGTRLDLQKLENMGITDIFLNEPEVYCRYAY